VGSPPPLVGQQDRFRCNPVVVALLFTALSRLAWTRYALHFNQRPSPKLLVGPPRRDRPTAYGTGTHPAGHSKRHCTFVIGVSMHEALTVLDVVRAMDGVQL